VEKRQPPERLKQGLALLLRGPQKPGQGPLRQVLRK
jgi:hypothetical protein